MLVRNDTAFLASEEACSRDALVRLDRYNPIQNSLYLSAAVGTLRLRCVCLGLFWISHLYAFPELQHRFLVALDSYPKLRTHLVGIRLVLGAGRKVGQIQHCSYAVTDGFPFIGGHSCIVTRTRGMHPAYSFLHKPI